MSSSARGRGAGLLCSSSELDGLCPGGRGKFLYAVLSRVSGLRGPGLAWRDLVGCNSFVLSTILSEDYL